MSIGGTISLASASAFDKPVIDPNFLSTQFDISTLVEAVKYLKRFLLATPWQGYIEQPFGEMANISTDSGIEAYIRKIAVSTLHPMGTARMSIQTDDAGVVGPDLLVKKTQGLRIVDASVFVSEWISWYNDICL
jgi:choline dehydrogenase-like flavoprotein